MGGVVIDELLHTMHPNLRAMYDAGRCSYCRLNFTDRQDYAGHMLNHHGYHQEEDMSDFRTEGVQPDLDDLLPANEQVVNHVCQDCHELLRTLADIQQHHCTEGAAKREAKTSSIRGDVSEVDDSVDLDAMVEAASIPNLASLFKQAKKDGLIEAMQGYPGGA